jgi:hypothetical protein
MHACMSCRVIASRKSSAEKREMKIAEARPIIEDMVSERLISDDAVRAFLLSPLPDLPPTSRQTSCNRCAVRAGR